MKPLPLDLDWEPREHERIYVRSATTGDLGWMCKREGKQCVRLDRPMQEIIKPYLDTEWIPESDHRPLTRLQLSQIAFEADKALCLYIGMHDLARREWKLLTERQRITWTETGPGRGSGRRELFLAVMNSLGHLAGR